MLSTTPLNGLVAILALCQVAAAFYPYMPEYRCIREPNCVLSARPNTPTIKEGATSVKLKQRLPQSKESRPVQVRKLRDSLARKYARATPAHQIQERKDPFPLIPGATPSQASSAPIDQDGTDYSYFAIIQVGSEGTPLQMLLDTGAGNTWVMGSDCISTPCSTHNTFGPADSKTYVPLVGESFSVAYGTGNVSGAVANDTITFAGMTLQMELGIANVTSDDFNSYPLDGILGLAPQLTGNQPSFIETLVTGKFLQSNVFGMSLNRNASGPNNGEINFGAPDTSRFSGNLSYSPVTVTGSWAISMDSIGSNGQDSGLSNRLTYIDTGTSYIFCPADDAKALHAVIPGSAVGSDGVTYSVPCSTTDSIAITFSGVSYNISSEDWVGPMTNGVCTSNIYGQPVIEDSWLLGDTFLKNVYAVFDVDETRIGFAQTIEQTVSSPATTSTTTGGPTSLSDTSSSSPSSTSALAPGPMTPAPKTSPNGASIGSASGTTAAPTGTASGSPNPGTPSQNNEVTSTVPSQTTSSAAPTSSQKSGAIRYDAGLSLVALAFLPIIAF